MKKKILSITLAATLMLGAFSAAYAGTGNDQTAGNTESDSEQVKTSEKAVGQEADFSDLKNTNWAYKAVNAMSQKGIVKGYADGTFKPNNTVTYAEFIKMAVIAATGEDVGNTETGSKQHWAKNYYDTAVEKGYFSKYKIEESKLSSDIPRGDMALIISGILGDTEVEYFEEIEASISDVNSKTENDYDIVKVYASGIITGYKEMVTMPGSTNIQQQQNLFKPEKTLSRAESATVIHRLADEAQRVKPDVIKQKESLPEKTSGTDISEVLSNADEIMARDIDEDYLSYMLNVATGYEYITDMSKYEFSIREYCDQQRADQKGYCLDINGQDPEKIGLGNMYVIENGKLGIRLSYGAYWDAYKELDITSYKYFAFLGGSDQPIRIMPNPYYAGN